MGADLFLSIHHDSVPDSFLEKWQYEGADHTFSDRFPGHSIFISNDNPQRARSLAFGKLLGDELKARGLKYTPHYTEKFMGHRRRVLVDAEAGVYRYDQLIVLRATRMPAVLLEAGSIINRDEELELGTPERRSLTSDAATAAVESFCALRPHPSRDLSCAHPAHARHTVRPAAAAPAGTHRQASLNLQSSLSVHESRNRGDRLPVELPFYGRSHLKRRGSEDGSVRRPRPRLALAAVPIWEAINLWWSSARASLSLRISRTRCACVVSAPAAASCFTISR